MSLFCSKFSSLWLSLLAWLFHKWRLCYNFVIFPNFLHGSHVWPVVHAFSVSLSFFFHNEVRFQYFFLLILILFLYFRRSVCPFQIVNFSFILFLFHKRRFLLSILCFSFPSCSLFFWNGNSLILLFFGCFTFSRTKFDFLFCVHLLFLFCCLSYILDFHHLCVKEV